MARVHLWQNEMLINGDRPKYAICGALYPHLTDVINEVTCKKCLKKIIKGIQEGMKYGGAQRTEAIGYHGN